MDHARAAVLRVAESIVQQTIYLDSPRKREWADGGKLIHALYGMVSQLYATYDGEEVQSARVSLVLDGVKYQVSGRGDVVVGGKI